MSHQKPDINLPPSSSPTLRTHSVFFSALLCVYQPFLLQQPLNTHTFEWDFNANREKKNNSPCDSLPALEPKHLRRLLQLIHTSADACTQEHTCTHHVPIGHTYSTHLPDQYPWMWLVLLGLFFYPMLEAQLSWEEATIHLWFRLLLESTDKGWTTLPFFHLPILKWEELGLPCQTTSAQRCDFNVSKSSKSSNWFEYQHKYIDAKTDRKTNRAAHVAHWKKPCDSHAWSPKSLTEANVQNHWLYRQEIL